MTDISVASNVLQFTASNGGITYLSSLTAGKRYRATFATGTISGTFKLRTWDGAAYVDIETLAASTTNIVEFVMPATTAGTNYLYLQFTSAGTIQLDASSVSNQIVEIGCVADYDLAFANQKQSLVVEDRSGSSDTGVNATGMMSASGVTQVTPIEQLNSKSARIGTSAATPADGDLLVSGNVGVGASPDDHRLVVRETTSDEKVLELSSANGSCKIDFSRNGDPTAFIKMFEDGASGTGALLFGTGTSVTPTTRLTIDSTGNSTFSGNVTATNTAGADLRLSTSAASVTDTNNIGKITWNAPSEGSGTNASIVAGEIALIADGGWDSVRYTPSIMTFKTTPVNGPAMVERLRIDSAGLATFSNGIAFSGQTESTTGTPAASSVLSHYETGIWTPVPWDNDVTQITTSVQLGVYIRVGKIVYCTYRFRRNDTATLTNALYICGLPFVVSNNVQTKNIGIGSSWLPEDGEAGFNYGLENTSSIIVMKNDASGYILSSDLSNTSYWYGAFTYESDV